MVLSGLGLPGGGARAEEWTPADTKDEEEAARYLAQSDFAHAEPLTRRVLQRHPDVASALIYHVEALDGENRLDEALAEAQRAVEITPDDALANEWLGMVNVRLGRATTAIPLLDKSLNANSDEVTTRIWLGAAYNEAGRTADAQRTFEAVLSGGDGEEHGRLGRLIAEAFYRTGDKAAALQWWTRSAKAGNSVSAAWLAWAYSNSYGVAQDVGESAYWARRSYDPPFAWFHRLPEADALTTWAGGWGLLLLTLLAAALLPPVTIGLLAFPCSRGLTTDPSVHWTERARAAYPFQVFLSGAMVFPVLAYLPLLDYFPQSHLPLPKALLFWGVLLVSLLASVAAVTRWTHCYRTDAGTTWQNLKDLGVLLYIYLSTLFLMMAITAFLPDHWNVQAALIIAATVLAQLWMNFGGWIRVARFLRILRPAGQEVREVVAGLATRLGQPVPTSWIVSWRKANAYALPLSNAVCVTEKALAALSREQLEAVFAHEMAHISESNPVRITRVLLPLFMFMPLFTQDLWAPNGILGALPFCLLALLAGAVIQQKLGRKMEVRADAVAAKAESSPGDYPAALERLYEANLVPAVMPGNRKIHPHLYDRLVASGITPNYPRPKPPSRWGVLAALALVLLNVAAMGSVWLALF